jgi:ubiquinone/menaquinone biosynthesis C-methylase UbiE
MSLANKISLKLRSTIPALTHGPEKAYDLLASQYDQDKDNLLLRLDENMLLRMLNNISLKHKIVADVGCGTGRHWPKLLAAEPAQLLGFDVSAGMLGMLKKKYPAARVYKSNSGSRLQELDDVVCDIVISTLAIGYIKDIETALSEWCRVLKKNGELIITDYHPDILSKGGNRSFIYNGSPLHIRNYIHPVGRVSNILQKYGMQMMGSYEKELGKEEKQYYEKQDALNVFQRFQGTPILYGLHLKKN